MKSFVRYGGAECFENVEVQYQTGQRATLTIFHDGEEFEKVDLESIESEAEMIQMMVDKNFHWKSPELVQMIRQIGREEKQKEEEERNERIEEAKRKMEAFRQKKLEEKLAKEKAGEL